MKELHLGDDGYTMLHNKKVPKYSLIVDFIGGLDELVSVIGFARAYLRERNVAQDVENSLREIQLKLLSIASLIASDSKHSKKPVDDAYIKKIEDLVKRYWSALGSEAKPIFVIPGASLESSILHIARTVCRRVERTAAKLLHEGILDEDVYRFLNRLSDLLYVYARYINMVKGVGEDYE